MIRTPQLAVLMLALLVLSIPVLAADTEQALLKKISSAQNTLSVTEKRIARERLQLAEKLNKLEQDVLALQKKTSVARRLADEKTLSLSQLESRLDSWHQQQAYQHNLLNRFIQQHTADTGELPTRLPEQIATVVELSKKMERRFFPTWETADIVVSDGVIQSLPMLSIGPINWYWQDESDRAGVATAASNGLQSEFLLSGSQSSGLEQLMTTGEGTLAFDPTLERAMVREKNSESLFEHIAKGGFWVIPILLFGAFALTIALLKVVQLWRLPKLVRFTPAVLKSLISEPGRPVPVAVTGMQKQLLDIGRASTSPRNRDDQLFLHLQNDKTWLERWIGAIAITASVSPLLGLLGTVSGMIETFKMMTLFGAGDPEVVSGGIAQALITTELGLVVAIPALVLHAILNRRARDYYLELENFAIMLGQDDELEATAPSVEKKNQRTVAGTAKEKQFDTESIQGVPI